MMFFRIGYFKLFSVFLIISSFKFINAEVLELEESQVQGKKDQPEAMTFISRTPLERYVVEYNFDALQAINNGIVDSVFGLGDLGSER